VLENKNREIGDLRNQIHDMSGMAATINGLQDKIQRLVGENKSI